MEKFTEAIQAFILSEIQKGIDHALPMIKEEVRTEIEEAYSRQSPRYLSVDEAIQFVGVSRPSFMRMVNEDRLPKGLMLACESPYKFLFLPKVFMVINETVTI